jgi:hypothetical protein
MAGENCWTKRKRRNGAWRAAKEAAISVGREGFPKRITKSARTHFGALQWTAGNRSEKSAENNLALIQQKLQTSTPSPNKKAGSLKPNMAVCAPNKLSPPFSLSTTSANEPQQQSPSPAKKSSGFAAKPEKQQKGAALKLGAVKKPAHAQQSKQIGCFGIFLLYSISFIKKLSDKDLDTLLGMEDTRSSEEKKLDKSVKDGNFASVAKQISQQQPKPPVQKQQKEKVEGASNWQEW